MILKNGKRLDGCSDTVPIGTLNPYIGSTPPFGYLICEGQLVDKATYPELYAICGSTFGTETATQFYLPDLRGQTIAGYKQGDSDFGTLGALIGSKYLQEHTHQDVTWGYKGKKFIYTGVAGNTETFDLAGSGIYNANIDSGGTTHLYTGGVANNIQTGNSGNIQPTMVLNWIVKAFMLMPNQSMVSTVETTSDINTYSCNYINSLQEKATKIISFYRTSGWNTSSTTDVDIPNATATVTTNGGNVLVTVTTALSVTDNMAFINLYVDDTLYGEVLCINAEIGYQSITASRLVTNLSKGEHTFDLKIHVQNTSNVGTVMTYNTQQMVIQEL